MKTYVEDLIPAQRLRESLCISPNGELSMRARGALPQPIKIGKQNYYVRTELESKLGLTIPEEDIDHG